MQCHGLVESVHGLFGCSSWNLVLHGLSGKVGEPYNSGMTLWDV